MPYCLVDLVHSFHDRMAATVSVSGEDAPPFEVRKSELHHCSNFILYFEHVGYVILLGIALLYKMVGKLVGGCTRRPSSFHLFADYATLISTSRSDMVTAAKVLE